MSEENNFKNLESFLEKIGLSQYERGVYLALVELEEASIAEINKNCAVPLPKIYETLNELSKKGLVRLSAHQPKRYKIIHPQKAFEKIIKTKEERLSRLKEEKEKALQIFEGSDNSRPNTLEVLTGQADVYSFLIKKARLASKSYDAVLTLKNIPDPLLSIFKHKIKSGFKVRIVGSGGREKIAREYIKIGAKVRLSNKLEISTRFSIWDKKFLVLTLPDIKPIYTTIITDSPTLVRSYYQLFLRYWRAGQKL